MANRRLLNARVIMLFEAWLYKWFRNVAPRMTKTHVVKVGCEVTIFL